MWKYMTNNDTNRIIDALPQLVDKYNNSIHSTIKITRVEASKLVNRDKVYNTAFKVDNVKKEVIENVDIKEGDRVRVAKIKKEGAKGYEPNWSDEIFIIHEVEETNPVTFILKDGKKHIIKGPFHNKNCKRLKLRLPKIWVIKSLE